MGQSFSPQAKETVSLLVMVSLVKREAQRHITVTLLHKAVVTIAGQLAQINQGGEYEKKCNPEDPFFNVKPTMDSFVVESPNDER